MTDANLDIRRDGDSLVIAISGEIDLSNADPVEDAINGAVTNTVGDVTLDLIALRYVDSAGMRILFELAVRLQTLQIDLVVAAPIGSPARRVIELSGLTEIARLEPS